MVNCYKLIKENEPPIIPRRKVLSQGPSKEYVFRPCCKLVKLDKDNKAKYYIIILFS
jgi:hypothetical protein